MKEETDNKNSAIRPSSNEPGPEVLPLFMLNAAEHEIFLLINVKMPTIVGILSFMSGKNSIIGLTEPKKSQTS